MNTAGRIIRGAFYGVGAVALFIAGRNLVRDVRTIRSLGFMRLHADPVDGTDWWEPQP